MSAIGAHPRVFSRHPEVTDDDVVAGLRGMIRYKQRASGEWLAVSLDNKNRLVGLVYQYDEEEDFFFCVPRHDPAMRQDSSRRGGKAARFPDEIGNEAEDEARRNGEVPHTGNEHDDADE